MSDQDNTPKDQQEDISNTKEFIMLFPNTVTHSGKKYHFAITGKPCFSDEENGVFHFDQLRIKLKEETVCRIITG